ncbi:GIY-YIG nuclease family protein [Sansalvadorimonas verongulae]|uniref:GIY-YIG nuclease family protein n=1 Tax=Sansalvadorimonas verongulae TaxID=2172824 RepID=UPI0012BBEEDC|nr:GIY-YIG nuclease family protein [Sansalvadorimonas verongulae]MTI12522.1 hypothetical protein [Sansalvadorimonas verongulae]
MIIFTVTNTVTSQIYVGSTRNDLEAQWERMVAAAEQNLDYPLYRDIRTHGCDAFTREIYDMADSRQELAELEQDAVDSLNAISLRGHKTSTVVIKKKAPVRRKKSEAEKELLDLLDTFASDASDDLPMEGVESKDKDKDKEKSEAKGRIIKADTPAQPVIQQQTSAPQSTARPAAPKAASGRSSFDAVAAAKAILAQAAKEQEEKEKAAAVKPKPADPKRTSRTTGNVKVEVSIDDTINAQLAAITAAVDGVLAGNSDAASQLETQTRTVEVTPVAAERKSAPVATAEPTIQTEAAPAVEANPAVEAPVTVEPPKPVLSEKELRIMEAMERHREGRAKRTSEVVDAEKKHIQELLAELNSRVEAIPLQGTTALH